MKPQFPFADLSSPHGHGRLIAVHIEGRADSSAPAFAVGETIRKSRWPRANAIFYGNEVTPSNTRITNNQSLHGRWANKEFLWQIEIL